MPFINGQLKPVSSGAPIAYYFPLDAGWLTAVSIFPQTDLINTQGPEYAQIFITFGPQAISSKALVLAQGICNVTDAVYWTGRQLVEEGMHLAFLLRTFNNYWFNYGYFIETICPGTPEAAGPRTDKC